MIRSRREVGAWPSTVRLGLLVAGLGAMTTMARAETVDVYFVGGSPVKVTGAGVVGQVGDQWNGISTPSNATSGSNLPLLDTTGASTGITLSYTGAGPDGGPFYSPTRSPNPDLTSTYSDSYTAGNPSNTIGLTLGGLSPRGVYDLYVYDVADWHAGTSRPGAVTLSSANGGSSATFDGNGNLSTWVEGSNYVLLSATASAGGVVSFQITPTGGNHEIDLNGLQLVSVASVPEPSSMILLGIAGAMVGAIGLVRRRRSP